VSRNTHPSPTAILVFHARARGYQIFPLDGVSIRGSSTAMGLMIPLRKPRRSSPTAPTFASPFIRRWRSALGPKVRQDRVDALVFECALGKAELLEDVARVGLYGLRRDVESLCDPAVGQALRHQVQHLAFSRR
jgi:hypothetical protein